MGTAGNDVGRVVREKKRRREERVVVELFTLSELLSKQTVFLCSRGKRNASVTHALEEGAIRYAQLASADSSKL